MLDAHQLNVFMVAAETLNFTKTAQRLHMTQPSVSQHIQSLEKHFDNKLFVRKGRHIELTDVGRTLMPLSREMVRLSQHIEETMESLKGDVHGHLLVGCSTTPGKYLLPHLLARFHEQFPLVSVACNVSSQKIAMEQLCEGDVHFALTSMPETTCRDSDYIPFYTDEIKLIVPLYHPWADRESVDVTELMEETFIMRELGSGDYHALSNQLAHVNIDIRDLTRLMTLGNSEAIALAVEEGLGIGFVSQIVIDKIVHGRVACIKVKGLITERMIYFGKQNRRPTSAAQSAFWDFIKEMENPLLEAVR